MFIRARSTTRSKIQTYLLFSFVFTVTLSPYLQHHHLPCYSIYITWTVILVILVILITRRLLTLSNQAFCVSSASIFLKLLAEKNLGGFIKFIDHSHMRCYSCGSQEPTLIPQ